MHITPHRPHEYYPPIPASIVLLQHAVYNTCTWQLQIVGRMWSRLSCDQLGKTKSLEWMVFIRQIFSVPWIRLWKWCLSLSHNQDSFLNHPSLLCCSKPKTLHPLAMATNSSTLEQPQTKLEELLNGPAGVPPPGILPNFNNPPNLHTSIFAAEAVCLTLTSLAVLIRLYTRHFLLRSVGYDDCQCWYSQLFYYSNALSRHFRIGMGKNSYDSRCSALTLTAKSGWLPCCFQSWSERRAWCSHVESAIERLLWTTLREVSNFYCEFLYASH